eukprot:scaffold728_cov197-Chaetoceros_neogracile.AAC.6
MAASGDEEKQNLGEETTSMLVVLKEEIRNQKASFEALQIEFKSLRAHVDNTNTHVLRPTTSSSAVKQDSDTDNGDLLYTLPTDTFTLMMVYNPLTSAWNIGIFSFILQMLLLILILISQINEGDGSTPFNVPFKVENEIRIGQFAVILVCVLSQDDVLTSLQSICALWKCNCTAFQDLSATGGQDDLSTSGHNVFADNHYDLSIQATAVPLEARRSRDRKFYALHILLPNLLKFAQGVFVLLVSLVIVAQGENLIDLLKDSTALFFVSSIDNVIFFCANTGYFGQKVGRQAQATTEKSFVDGKKWSFKVRSFVVIIIGSIMITALSTVTYGQLSGNYFILKYPHCAVTDNVTAISNMTNGVCNGGELNTLGCAFDGGDCINHNLAFPGCNVDDPEVLLGNGVCDGGLYNTPECKYDNGDCIIVNYPDCHSFDDMKLFGDGDCHLEFNTAPCGYDKGHCELFNKYPNCNITDPDQLGDGTCNTTIPYNTLLCGYDGGDCVVDVIERQCSGIKSASITELEDGKCNARNNNQACGWDGKDCLEFNAKYPACGAKYNSTVDPERVGDGKCDNFGGYNSLACGNDGSDCSSFNLQYPECEGENPDVIGDGKCDPEFNNVECGFDGYDCDPDYLDCSTATISSALALCDDLRSRYPNCTLANKNANRYRNFDCDLEFNSTQCGFDGGDCSVVPNYPNCTVEYPGWIGDDRCDGGDYNTIDCGSDGGDCDEFNAEYPNCNVEDPYRTGDGRCDGGDYNTTECGFDGEDCVCDVANFDELQGAIIGNGDIKLMKLCSGTIVFTEQIDLSGKQLTFTCPNGGCVLDAAPNSRLFYINGGTSDISFDGITFQNGNATGSSGGAILNSDGTVDIFACRFVDNTAIYGGAIRNIGSMVITGSEFVGNTVSDSGGAIGNGGEGPSSVTITRSQFINNKADVSGGAISQFKGTAVITGSNFEGNTASNDSNNIWNKPGDVFTCNDGNEFKNPVGSTYPVGLCG